MLNNSPFNTFFGLHDEINHFSIVIEIPKIPVVPPISEIWICTFEEENIYYMDFSRQYFIDLKEFSFWMMLEKRSKNFLFPSFCCKRMSQLFKSQESHSDVFELTTRETNNVRSRLLSSVLTFSDWFLYSSDAITF